MNIKFLRKAKKGVAGVLAAAMVLTGLPMFGGITAHALELEENTTLSGVATAGGLGQPVLSDSATLMYGNASGFAGTNGFGPHYSFNVSAIRSERDPADPIFGYNTELKTSYGSNWFGTYYAFGKPNLIKEVTPENPGANTVLETGATVDPKVTAYEGDNVHPSSAQAPGIGKTELNRIGQAGSVTKNGQVATVPIPGGGGNIEVRTEFKPSADSQWIILEYTVYNDSGNEVDFNIGHETDTQIYNQDHCPIIVTKQDGATSEPDEFEGLHMIANAGSTYAFTNFDVLTYHPDPSLNFGVTKRASGTDNSETRAWAGQWSATAGVNHNQWAFSKSPQSISGGQDSAAAFSAYLNLLAHETKTVRFGLSMKPSVYYVDKNAPAGGSGFILTPCKTIADAVAKIRTNGAPKAYIFLMDDAEIDSTIEIPANTSITIQTTDFVLPAGATYSIAGRYGYRNAPTPYPFSDPRKIVSRAGGFDGDLFKVPSSTSSLTIGDVTIDGGNSTTSTGSLIYAPQGTVRMRKNAKLINNKINPDAGSTNTDKASAIEIGSGTFEMSFGTIENNTSIAGPAVNFNGTYCEINNEVKIKGNLNSNGEEANLRLGDGKHIVVGEDIGGSSQIGISVTDPPITPGGERIIVTPKGGVTVYPYSAANFQPDKTGNTIGLSSTGADPKNVVLTSAIYSWRVRHINAANQAVLAPDVSGTSPVAATFTKSPITGSPLPAGYSVVGVQISPPGIPSSILNINPGTKVVSGEMPNTDVIVTFEYSQSVATSYFDTTGGYPLPPLSEVAAAGAPSTLTMPVPSKPGYVFAGWNKFTDTDGNKKFDAGEPDLGPKTALDTNQGDHFYYANWTPGTTQYTGTVVHSSTGSHLVKNFASKTTQKLVDDRFDAAPLLIPAELKGYVVNGPASSDSPQQDVWTGTTKFDPGNNFAYSIKMKAQNFNVNYKYNVDPSVKFNFKVIHKKVTGEIIQEPVVQKITEQLITAQAISIQDYECSSATIITGKTGTLDTANPVRTSGTDDYKQVPTDPDFDAADNYKFRSYMPNQDVTIEYIYSPEGDYFVNSVFTDAVDNTVLKRESEAQPVLAPFTKPNPNIYGYLVNAANSTQDPSVGAFDPITGDYTGTMPNANLLLKYSMDRDPALWSTITFHLGAAPNNNGSFTGTTTGSFLRDDGTTPGRTPDTFAKIGQRGLVPTPVPNDPPFYRFSGWFKDAACTMPVADTDVFTGDTDIYAKFDEDPAHWIDINFASGPNGSITAPTTLHTKLTHTWQDIAAVRPSQVLPNSTPNYEFDKWTNNGTTVTDTTVLVNGATYMANFRKVAAVWGLNVGDFNPSGHVGADGSGEIVVRETQANNVYVVSDLAGNIVAVLTSPADGNITFRDLYPGTRYNVQEGTPDTVATVGQPVGSITGTAVSAPKEVLIPTVEDNYNVGFDPDNEDRAQIVVNPADPDSDYALIDEAGNIVPYPSSDNGWMSPVGSNPSTVTFNNLNPGETYRVVARKKGDTSVPSPLDKINEGNDINANPGDMVDAKKFIVETLGDTSSMVNTVNGNAVSISRFEEAKEGDDVTITTAAVNANGQAFKYWKVIAGRSRGVSGKITTTDFSFKMSSSNIVFRAVYERPTTVPSNAIAEEEIRGGAQGEFALDPNGISTLEDALTTPEDEILMDINGADVTYRIVFNKRNAKSAEETAVKPVSIAGSNHPTAFSAAWGLDIRAERYVDGRLVGRATPSNASVEAIIQLPNEDTDMLDYELFDVTPDSLGVITPVQMTMSVNPEDTAGLFRFTGMIGHSYVLVYSKTFKLRFIDNNPVMDYLHLNDVSRNFYHVLKIRRKEAPTDAWYNDPQLWTMAEDYKNSLLTGRTVRPTAQPGVTWEVNFADIYGVEYSFVDWSRKNMPKGIAAFDPDAAVTKTSPIFAYYLDNRKEVTDARTELTGLIDQGNIFLGDPYIADDEVSRLTEALKAAQARIDQKRGELLNYDFGSGLIDPQRMAIYEELKQAIDELSRLLKEIGDNIANRRNRFNGYTGGSGGGGSGSSGRGIGSKKRPLEHTTERTFTLGVDGQWEINPATQRWAFVLNGGLPLNNTWGKIQFPDANGKLITKWYFFDGRSSMVEGWYHDQKLDKWYFLNTAKGSDNGQMLKGWFFDKTDNKWYYLDPVLGEMYKGWSRIGDKWYYFSPTSVEGHPTGSLYISTTTPDGYKVNHDGEWIQ